MKKFFKIFILSMCLTLPAVFCFTACDNKHNFENIWSYDETYHYLLCTEKNCEEKQNVKTHNYGEWIIDSPATTKDSGSKHIECVECHYVKTETIPALISSGLKFKLDDSGLGYIVVSVGSCKDDYISIPNEYYGLPVTAIADNAFEDCDIIGVTFPDSMEQVSSTAFSNCSYLGTMIFGKKLLDSGEIKNILSSNPTVKNVSVTNTTTEIPDDAFYSCSSIKNIDIPNSIVSIGECAFDQCTGLTNLVIPDSVTSISSHAFAWCRNVKNLTIGKGLTTISHYAFGYCSSLENITFLGNLEVLDIGAFCSCSSLKTITLPDSLTKIGYETFCNCSNLETITIPNNVTTVGEKAFRSCSSLKTVICGKNLNTIDTRAFYECGLLESVQFSNNLTTLGLGAFAYCNALDNVVIPTNVTTINEYTFQNCLSLKNITLHKNITTIKTMAFYNCSSLEHITIYNKLTCFENNIFYDCNSLIANYEYDNACYLGSEENPYLILYKAKDATITTCQINVNTKFINSYAFKDCNLLENVNLPNNLLAINSYAFNNCSQLTNITIPSSLEYFEYSVFNNCDNIVFNEYANGCYLGYADNPYLILYKCKNSEITTCTINENVKFIERYIFSYHNNLSSIYLPKTINYISDTLFDSCSGLRDVYYAGTKAEWNNIDKHSEWLMRATFDTLHCTDGDFSRYELWLETRQ